MAGETQDPWAEFRATPAPQGGGDPWAMFRVGPQPEKNNPGVMGYAKDIGDQALKGFNKGLATVVGLPYRGVDYAIEKVTGTGGLPDFETLSLWKHYLNPSKPQTEPGRYAQKAGEVVGASSIPSAALLKAAPAMAALAPTTTARATAQAIGENIAAAPGVATALDAASAATGGLAERAAEDAGYGPAGQTIAGMVGGMVPGVGLAYRTTRGGRVGTETGENLATQRASDAARDAAAFDDLGVRPFGPAFNQGPVASVAKQLTETPILGAPLKNALDETYADMARATGRLADQISPHATPESAGLAVPAGLERFRTSRLQDIEPGVVRGLGIDPVSPVPAAVPRSAGQLRDAASAAPVRAQIGADTAQTTRGVTVPAARPISETRTARTTIEALDEDELMRVIRQPADQTSFGVRQEALYERARRMVPDMMRTDGSANPNLIPAVNTRQALQQIDGNIASQITNQTTLSGPLADRLRNIRSANFQLDDLFRIRTEIGRDLGRVNQLESTLDRTQLNQLYAAVSRDIEIGLETLANRAAIRTQGRGNTGVPVDVARQAAGALNAFRTADRYTRASMARMDRFLDLMKAKSPEAVTRRLVQAAQVGDKGNAGMIRNAMGVLRPEERAEFGAMIVRDMGTPAPSARGIVQERGFSAQTFVTNYQRMNPEVRDMVFTPEHNRALEQLFNVANRIANVEALANTSRTGTNTMNVTGAVAGIGSALSGNLVTPLAIGSTGAAMSILMSRPAYVQWMTTYIQLRAAVRNGSDRMVAPMLRHVAGLERQARANPHLMPALYAVAEDIEGMKKK